jgi:hypothetical protein
MTEERQEALANEASFTRIARDAAHQLQMKLTDALSKIDFLAAFLATQVRPGICHRFSQKQKSACGNAPLQGHDVDFLLRSRSVPVSAALHSEAARVLSPPPDGWRPATPGDGSKTGQRCRLLLLSSFVFGLNFILVAAGGWNLTTAMGIIILKTLCSIQTRNGSCA